MDGEVFFLKVTEESRRRSGFGRGFPSNYAPGQLVMLAWRILVFVLIGLLVDEGLSCEVLLACRKSP